MPSVLYARLSFARPSFMTGMRHAGEVVQSSWLAGLITILGALGYGGITVAALAFVSNLLGITLVMGLVVWLFIDGAYIRWHQISAANQHTASPEIRDIIGRLEAQKITLGPNKIEFASAEVFRQSAAILGAGTRDDVSTVSRMRNLIMFEAGRGDKITANGDLKAVGDLLGEWLIQGLIRKEPKEEDVWHGGTTRGRGAYHIIFLTPKGTDVVNGLRDAFQTRGP